MTCGGHPLVDEALRIGFRAQRVQFLRIKGGKDERPARTLGQVPQGPRDGQQHRDSSSIIRGTDHIVANTVIMGSNKERSGSQRWIRSRKMAQDVTPDCRKSTDRNRRPQALPRQVG
jgi:hypothetical protein